jgi:predicted NAD/FAD-binding protein
MINLNEKIAIIGSGIAGLGMSYIAQKNHKDITLFEKSHYFGGHSNTIDINVENKSLAVDTGFLVHNKLTYPNLIQLFDQLNVDIVDSDMSLSIHHLEDNIEWAGADLNTVFGQRKNLFNPRFYFFLMEILKFNKNAHEYLKWADQDHQRTLDDLLKKYRYSEKIKDWYIIPMAAAIWSTPANKILEFPAYTFLHFSLNHHLLQVNDRPVWRTLKGGSRNYVKKITDNILDKRLNQDILSVERVEIEGVRKVLIETKNGPELFDKVIFACHPDQSLALIKNITKNQERVLKAFKYEKNLAVVHSDESFLPKKKELWSSWNYISSKENNKVSVSYLINKLQPLDTNIPIMVTLNPHKKVNDAKKYREIEYEHPLFDTTAINMQNDIDLIQGENAMYFAGAWGGYGFHEDGLKSAVKVALKMNMKIPWKESV